LLYANELIGFKKVILVAISLATVPVTPMTFVQFNFKLYKKLRNSQNKNMPICIYSMVYDEAHVVIQERQGDYTVSVFLKESFRPVLLLWRYICVYVRLSDWFHYDDVPDPWISSLWIFIFGARRKIWYTKLK
jgi:hypothetical protein